MKIQIDDLVRDATPEEIIVLEQEQQETIARKEAERQAEETKIIVAAKLAALGLTSDDLKALGLGGN